MNWQCLSRISNPMFAAKRRYSFSATLITKNSIIFIMSTLVCLWFILVLWCLIFFVHNRPLNDLFTGKRVQIFSRTPVREKCLCGLIWKKSRMSCMYLTRSLKHWIMYLLNALRHFEYLPVLCLLLFDKSIMIVFFYHSCHPINHRRWTFFSRDCFLTLFLLYGSLTHFAF